MINRQNLTAKAVIILTALAFLYSCARGPETSSTDRVKTTFQTSQPWRPIIDTRADAVMVYGAGKSLEEDGPKGNSAVENRIRSWKERGYRVDFMTERDPGEKGH